MAKNNNNSLKKRITTNIKNIIFSTQGFPIFLILTVLAIFFVVFRMKNVDQDYTLNTLKKKIHKEQLEEKDLNAKKARLLSVENLREIAKNHSLAEPKEEQIIVIPK